MADDAKYEVGQVVVAEGATTQFVYFGSRPSSSNHAVIGADGKVYDANLWELRPLAPGEAPTIDGRGYPIEAKPENPFPIDSPAFYAWKNGAPKMAKALHDGIITVEEADRLDGDGGVDGLVAAKEQHCQGATSRTCTCARLHPGQCGSSRAGTLQPTWATDHEGFQVPAPDEPLSHEDWHQRMFYTRDEVLGMIRASLGVRHPDGIDSHEAYVNGVVAQGYLAGEILSRLQRTSGPPAPEGWVDPLGRPR